MHDVAIVDISLHCNSGGPARGRSPCGGRPPCTRLKDAAVVGHEEELRGRTAGIWEASAFSTMRALQRLVVAGTLVAGSSALIAGVPAVRVGDLLQDGPGDG